MRMFVVIGAIAALLASPVNAQKLPNFDVAEICAGGAQAVSAEDCKKNSFSMFCSSVGQREINRLCVMLDEQARADLTEQWSNITSEQKRLCITYSLSNIYFSFNAVKHCIDGEVQIEPIIDNPDFTSEYWYDRSIMVPKRNLIECNETRKRVGNVGFCVSRSQG